MSHGVVYLSGLESVRDFGERWLFKKLCIMLDTYSTALGLVVLIQSGVMTDIINPI